LSPRQELKATALSAAAGHKLGATQKNSYLHDVAFFSYQSEACTDLERVPQ